eukprot:Clim_evm3s239 gene=Clim_evmTU3s239
MTANCICNGQGAGDMIGCDGCDNWYHLACLDITPVESAILDKFYCHACHRDNGIDSYPKSLTLKELALVNQYRNRIRSWPFHDSVDVVLEVSGSDLTLSLLEKTGFKKPIVVREPSKLGMTLPDPENFGVDEVCRVIGGRRMLDVIDVARQEDFNWDLNKWVKYYNTPYEKKSKILNVISLEFSDTKLRNVVQSPSVVRTLDWIDKHWPSGQADKKPKVQYYCLMGVRDSYTDFHIDFAGTSVWYHVLKGRKIFFLVPPTPENLVAYETWVASPNQARTFFASLVPKTYRIELTAGNTFMIPSGWIHAVFTPCDSLVFGGNFLHDYAVPMQQYVFNLENRVEIPGRFQFPRFAEMSWYAAKAMLDASAGDYRNLKGSWKAELKQVHNHFQEWLRSPKKIMSSVPDNIDSSRLLEKMEMYIEEMEHAGVSFSKSVPSETDVKQMKPKAVSKVESAYKIHDALPATNKGTTVGVVVGKSAAKGPGSTRGVRRKSAQNSEFMYKAWDQISDIDSDSDDNLDLQLKAGNDNGDEEDLGEAEYVPGQDISVKKMFNTKEYDDEGQDIYVSDDGDPAGTLRRSTGQGADVTYEEGKSKVVESKITVVTKGTSSSNSRVGGSGSRCGRGGGAPGGGSSVAGEGGGSVTVVIKGDLEANAGGIFDFGTESDSDDGGNQSKNLRKTNGGPRKGRVIIQNAKAEAMDSSDEEDFRPTTGYRKEVTYSESKSQRFPRLGPGIGNPRVPAQRTGGIYPIMDERKPDPNRPTRSDEEFVASEDDGEFEDQDVGVYHRVNVKKDDDDPYGTVEALRRKYARTKAEKMQDELMKRKQDAAMEKGVQDLEAAFAKGLDEDDDEDEKRDEDDDEEGDNNDDDVFKRPTGSRKSKQAKRTQTQADILASNLARMKRRKK